MAVEGILAATTGGRAASKKNRGGFVTGVNLAMLRSKTEPDRDKRAEAAFMPG